VIIIPGLYVVFAMAQEKRNRDGEEELAFTETL
jgi:hypothetical protein